MLNKVAKEYNAWSKWQQNVGILPLLTEEVLFQQQQVRVFTVSLLDLVPEIGQVIDHSCFPGPGVEKGVGFCTLADLFPQFLAKWQRFWVGKMCQGENEYVETMQAKFGGLTWHSICVLTKKQKGLISWFSDCKIDKSPSAWHWPIMYSIYLCYLCTIYYHVMLFYV